MMKILLSNYHLRNFGGSELVTVELAEELLRRKHDVMVYSPNIGGKLDINHLNVVTSVPDLREFDIIWSHHGLLLDSLPVNYRPFIITNHMSSYVELEKPKYNPNLPDIVLANSLETRNTFPEELKKRAILFQNPAPNTFDPTELKNTEIVCITNHIAPELEPLGIKTIGKRPDGEFRVTADVLANYKAVICNGKTVQYALRLGLPIYLYDHFGGPGWLTESNFNTAEYYNFSGRGFTKKPTSVIKNELEVIPKPLNCPDRFKLEIVIDSLNVF